MMSASKTAIGRHTVELALQDKDVHAFAVIPETRVVVAAKGGAQVAFIDDTPRVEIRTHDSVDRYGDPIELTALAALSGDTLLAASFSSARQYKIEAERLLETHVWDLLSSSSTGNSVGVAADAAGRVKAAVAYDYLHLLRDDGTSVHVHEPDNCFWGVTVAPDGRYVANGRVDGTVELRNPADLTVARTLPGLSACVLTLAFSPNGRYLAAGDDSAQLLVWDLAANESIVIPGWTKLIALLWFSDSSGFVTMGLSRELYFHDLETLREDPVSLALPEYSPSYIQHAILRDDETLFAFIEEHGIVRVRFG